MAVCGSAEDRHGIVLAKSYPAKAEGVKTGMAVWQAKQACPGLICVPPHYDLYLRYSRMVRRIYADYTDKIEPFGMDESWLSLEGMGSLERDGLRFADEITGPILGIFVGVGVFGAVAAAKDAYNALNEIPRSRWLWLAIGLLWLFIGVMRFVGGKAVRDGLLTVDSLQFFLGLTCLVVAAADLCRSLKNRGSDGDGE